MITVDMLDAIITAAIVLPCIFGAGVVFALTAL